MPSLDFYALGSDFDLILNFILDQEGWSLAEMFSRHDEPLRTFTSRSAVRDAFDLDVTDADLALHAPAMKGAVVHTAVSFNPGAVPNATGRTDAEGWGLIQLYLRSPKGGRLRPSHTGHNTETRARQLEGLYSDHLGTVDAWDWAEVARVSGRLCRFIRAHSVTKSGSRVLLPTAAEVVRQGTALAPNA